MCRYCINVFYNAEANVHTGIATGYLYTRIKVCMNNDDFLKEIQVTIDCTHAVSAYLMDKNDY